jgi:hypothetical protein
MGSARGAFIKIFEDGCFYVDKGFAGGGDRVCEVLVLGGLAEIIDDGCFHK